jgi:hypothetical protein
VDDFPAQGMGKAIPYGTYDVIRDEAVVNVAITHETAEFAVESIRCWWQLLGSKAYPKARRLLICADAGGSNGTWLRAWKVHMQALADRLGIAVWVCQYPPDTRKWNQVGTACYEKRTQEQIQESIRPTKENVCLAYNAFQKSGLIFWSSSLS